MRNLFTICLFLFSLSHRSFSAPIELKSEEDLLKIARSYSALILFLGHGSKSQFGDLDSTLKPIDLVVNKLNATYGTGRWMAVFGGDPYNAEKPDIGAITKYLREIHGVHVLAVQSDVIIGWGGVDSYIDYVRYIPTVKIPVTDERGAPVMEKGEPKTQIHWGGFIDGKPAGPTATYLGPNFVKGHNPILKGVVTVGGGPIALEEAKYAHHHGVP